MLTAETGGIEYRSRRLLADRPVVAVKLLLIWGGGGAKGPADQECGSFNRDEESWEEAKQHAKAR